MAFKVVGEGTKSFTAPTQQDLLDGYLVKAMSTSAVSTSTAYEETIEVDKADAAGDIPLCVGVNIGSTTSGNPATIYRDGLYYFNAGGAIPAGNLVGPTGADPLAVEVATAGSAIGKALSAAGSADEVLVQLNI